MTASGKELSVIVVTHNSARCINDCLESLGRETRGLDIEVLLVDSGSRDTTVKQVRHRFPEVRVTACLENIGFAAANNVALSRARGRYVALLNPDTVVGPGAFQTLLAHLERNQGAGAVGPKLRLPEGRVQPECARNLPRLGNLLPWLLLLDKVEWALRFGNQAELEAESPPPGTLLDRFSLLAWSRSRTCEVESICGACMVMRRELLDEVGLLDETLPMYLDDIDYCRRIRDASWTIHYVAEAEVTHLWQQSSSPHGRDGDFYAMGCHAIWLFLRKHDGRAASGAFAMMALVAAPIRGVASVLGLGAAWALAREQAVAFWRHQLQMSSGLARWALRWPKAAPNLGFRRASCTEDAQRSAPAKHVPVATQRQRGR